MNYIDYTHALRIMYYRIWYNEYGIIDDYGTLISVQYPGRYFLYQEH